MRLQAWKAAQKAAAGGAGPADAGAPAPGKGDKGKFGGEAAAACAAAAKQALKAVDGHGGKKENVVKGFVGNLTKGGGVAAGPSGKGSAISLGGLPSGDWHCPKCKIVVFASKTQCFLCHTAKTDFTAAQLAAAAASANTSTQSSKDRKTAESLPLAAAVTTTRSTTKNPRTLLNEYCQKNKLPKVGITARPEKAKPAAVAAAEPQDGDDDVPWWERYKEEPVEENQVAGFRGKAVQHAADKDGKATVRFTKTLYATAEEAQQAAAVLGLFLVAGDRRMDRVLTSEFVPLWKEAEDDDVQRKKKEAQREKWREEQEARDAKQRKRQEALTQLYLSDSLFSMLAEALRTYSKGGTAELEGDVTPVLDELQRQGWTSEQARTGVRHGGANLDSAVDHLCLFEPESRLPDKFRAHGGAMPFQVVRSSATDAKAGAAGSEGPAGGAGAGLGGTGAGKSGFARAGVDMSENKGNTTKGAPGGPDGPEVLVAMGHSWLDAAAAVSASGGQLQTAACLLAWQAGGWVEGGVAGDLSEDAVEEKEALEAIYVDGGFSAQTNIWSVVVDGVSDLKVTFTLPPSYPLEAPPSKIVLEGRGAGSGALACWRCGQLLQLAKDMLGRFVRHVHVHLFGEPERRHEWCPGGAVRCVQTEAARHA